MKTIIFCGARYQAVEYDANVPAGIPSPKDQFEEQLYALAERMVQDCRGTQFEMGMQGPRWCVYRQDNKQGFIGAYTSEQEAFKFAYMWLMRKFLLGREK
jgi:hypothetical protein